MKRSSRTLLIGAIGISATALIIVAAFFTMQRTPSSSAPQHAATLPPDEIASGTTVIKMTQDGFIPATIRVRPGTKIVFRNEDTIAHWPASDLHPSHTIYPEFDPKRPIKPAEEWSFTFEKEGAWNMHDHLAPYLIGTITVTDMSTAPSSAKPSSERIAHGITVISPLSERVTEAIASFLTETLSGNAVPKRLEVKEIEDPGHPGEKQYVGSWYSGEKIFFVLYVPRPDTEDHRYLRVWFLTPGESITAASASSLATTVFGSSINTLAKTLVCKRIESQEQGATGLITECAALASSSDGHKSGITARAPFAISVGAKPMIMVAACSIPSDLAPSYYAESCI